jgi:hypothetical protein
MPDHESSGAMPYFAILLPSEVVGTAIGMVQKDGRWFAYLIEKQKKSEQS